jgi:hypothetical protein
VGFSIFGELTGCIYGNLKDGFETNVGSAGGTSTVRLYLKNGNEVWVGADVKSKTEGQEFSGDYKIISL